MAGNALGIGSHDYKPSFMEKNDTQFSWSVGIMCFFRNRNTDSDIEAVLKGTHRLSPVQVTNTCDPHLLSVHRGNSVKEFEHRKKISHCCPE